MVGGEETLSEIHGFLNDDSVLTIGIVGMGGIGKTTIMKKLESELLHDRSHGFDLVIWVTVSEKVDVYKIQKQIAYRAGFSLSSSAEDFERAHIVSNALSRTRFMLLMDDLWEALDFQGIGIPLPIDGRKAKIVFTTRSEEVCNDMDTDKRLKVPLLNPRQSSELFLKKLNSNTVMNDPSIYPHVQFVIARCGGLPLLLITVARALASYRKAGEWKDAVRSLKNSPTELRGMEDVVKLIKFSFDHLKDEYVQHCLLYCSLYREDTDLYIDRLIKYWIGEGFLDMPRIASFEEAHNKGLVVVNRLQCAGLLEPGYTDLFVKMHDVVRDMALSLTTGNDHQFLVYDRQSIKMMHDYKTWASAERVFLEKCEIEVLPEGHVPCCPHLVTLIVRENPKFEKLNLEFFRFMPLLRVLDLSRTSLLEIPTSLGLLVELQYLGLHGTKIRFVPMELGNLVKLRQLHLGGTEKLDVIPQQVILKMSSLQLLNLSNSKYEWGEVHFSQDYPGTTLLRFQDLENLKYLEDLGIVVKSTSSLQTVLGNPFILSVITSISLEKIELTNDHLLSVSANFPKLINLYIDSCSLSDELRFEGKQLVSLRYLNICNLSISKVIMAKNVVEAEGPIHARGSYISRSSHPLQNIRVLYVSKCSSLTELTWIGLLPLVEQIHLRDCRSVKEIIRETCEERKEDISNCYFPKLFNLCLQNLQSLRNISSSEHPLLFASLKFLQVDDCPELTSLSFGIDSCQSMESIRGNQQWWDGLNWVNDNTRLSFTPLFQPIL